MNTTSPLFAFNPTDTERLLEAIALSKTEPGFWLVYNPNNSHTESTQFDLFAGVRVSSDHRTFIIDDLRASRWYRLAKTPTKPDSWSYSGLLQVGGYDLSVGHGMVSGRGWNGLGGAHSNNRVMYVPEVYAIEGVWQGIQWCAQHLGKPELVPKLEGFLLQIGLDLEQGHFAGHRESFFGGI